MAGLAHFYKVVGSGLVSSFQTIHSIFSSVFRGFPLLLFLLCSILILSLLLCNGCSFCGRSGAGTAPTLQWAYASDLLQELDLDWSLTFRPAWFVCVQPVFHCIWCTFEWTLDICLVSQTPATLDIGVLMSPLATQFQDCPLGLWLLHNARFELLAYEETCALAHGSPDAGFANMDAGCPVTVSASAVTVDHVCSLKLMTWAVD